ncbi:kynurenine 3-monooxygenase-like isoform X2 [Biomphalaria glabrata]|uniref:Kynurenine 3-monooxygenase-like isoform X2 n=1 Tax=Biomphalaria glabrata TaxID=6526 RepID=A0A9W3A134_BIOGL|nr:kynurenine 3-monooxygenase-like isoform X2 [Biomphalaria glabrata]
MDKMDVVIVGAGLVGCVEGIYLKKRGHNVTIYETFEDPRTWSEERARSINLTMSPRGQFALREIGLEDKVLAQGILAKGRIVHDGKGNKFRSPYNEKGEGIVSLRRTRLNAFLIQEAEETYKIPFHFRHTFERCDTSDQHGAPTTVCVFRNTSGEKETMVKAQADLVIGSDGAHSVVRQDLQNKRKIGMFQQEYHDHGYMELVVPSGNDGQPQMELDMLHIWPRGEFMLITFPNLDNTFSGTLFMPFEKLDEVMQGEEVLLKFFNAEFPDLVRLVGESYLKRHFVEKKKRPGRLISNKVEPYHADNIVLIGDAAHAMVPFYGQGMNAGFEDCLILDRIFQKYGHSKANLGRVLKEFSRVRCKDGHAISEMAFKHYVELRSDIAGVTFYMRKFVDNMLFRLLPKTWVPEYTMVAFTDMPYSVCLKETERQSRIITSTLIFCGIAFFGILVALFFKFWVWP